MRVQLTDNSVTLWLSASDTEDWASGHASWGGGRWPCSVLAGRRLVAAFDSGGLLEFAVNGRDFDCPVDEFNAITSDALRSRLPESHPCYFATVGQFSDPEIPVERRGSIRSMTGGLY